MTSRFMYGVVLRLLWYVPMVTSLSAFAYVDRCITALEAQSIQPETWLILVWYVLVVPGVFSFISLSMFVGIIEFGIQEEQIKRFDNLMSTFVA